VIEDALEMLHILLVVVMRTYVEEFPLELLEHVEAVTFEDFSECGFSAREDVEYLSLELRYR
jgi:hypothetical protein